MCIPEDVAWHADYYVQYQDGHYTLTRGSVSSTLDCEEETDSLRLGIGIGWDSYPCASSVCVRVCVCVGLLVCLLCGSCVCQLIDAERCVWSCWVRTRCVWSC